MTVRLQPGSNPGCQMEVLQRETVTRLVCIVPVQDRHNVFHGPARWQVSHGLNCSIRGNWLQTAYCWYFTVASVEVQCDCFQSETSSIECIQKTTRRSIPNGVDEAYRLCAQVRETNRAESAGGTARERPPRGDDG
jgi:hypothetical protein